MFIPTKEAFYDMSPTDFEKYSLNILKEQFSNVENLKIDHNIIVEVADGNYQLDGLIEFTQAGLKYKILVECKHYKSSITREKVVVLYDKLRAIGAQKGVLISSSNFQSGAIKYATEHGIALIQITPAETKYETRSKMNIIVNNNCLYNNGKSYVGVLQTQGEVGINCSYLSNRNQRLYEYVIKK